MDALKIDRAAHPEPQLGIHFNWRAGLDQLPGRLRQPPVDDKSERPLVGVVTQQHNAARKVGIRHLRHRYEEKRCGVAGHGAILIPLTPDFWLSAFDLPLTFPF